MKTSVGEFQRELHRDLSKVVVKSESFVLCNPVIMQP